MKEVEKRFVIRDELGEISLIENSGISQGDSRIAWFSLIGGGYLTHTKDSRWSYFRIDINPAKAKKEVLECLRKMIGNQQGHYTRIDVAIDYSVDLGETVITSKKAIKKAGYWARDGSLETYYLGSHRSKKRYRIYNKAKEQKISNCVWWRVEVQHRLAWCENVLPEDLFDDLVISQREEDLSIEEIAVIEYIQRNPWAIERLPRRKKQKYKDLLKVREKIKPAEDYKNHRTWLFEEVKRFAKPQDYYDIEGYGSEIVIDLLENKASTDVLRSMEIFNARTIEQLTITD